eukprot:gene19004-21083_t
MDGPHHPFTTCCSTAPDRHALARDFAAHLTRLSGSEAIAMDARRPVATESTRAGAIGPLQRAHVVWWKSFGIAILSPGQWAAVPQDAHAPPMLNVAAVWGARAADFYAEQGIADPERNLMPLWATLCTKYLVRARHLCTPGAAGAAARRAAARGHPQPEAGSRRAPTRAAYSPVAAGQHAVAAAGPRIANTARPG